MGVWLIRRSKNIKVIITVVTESDDATFKTSVRVEERKGETSIGWSLG